METVGDQLRIAHQLDDARRGRPLRASGPRAPRAAPRYPTTAPSCRRGKRRRARAALALHAARARAADARAAVEHAAASRSSGTTAGRRGAARVARRRRRRRRRELWRDVGQGHGLLRAVGHRHWRAASRVQRARARAAARGAFEARGFELDVLSCEGAYCGAHGHLRGTHAGCYLGARPSAGEGAPISDARRPPLARRRRRRADGYMMHDAPGALRRSL